MMNWIGYPANATEPHKGLVKPPPLWVPAYAGTTEARWAFVDRFRAVPYNLYTP